MHGLKGMLVDAGESPVLGVCVARLLGPQREGLRKARDGVIFAGERRALLGHADFSGHLASTVAATVLAGRRVEAAVGAETGGRLARLECHLVL